MGTSNEAWSRSRIKSLGKRLTAQVPPNPEDVELLHSLLSNYDNALTVAVARVEQELGVRTTARLKNTGTILEKLHRLGGHALPGVQDLAGMRIVEDLDWSDQDELARQLQELFLDGEREPKKIDRRIEPSFGYRAVHLVVYVGQVPVEIQIRTLLQHEWANLFEKLADAVGRGYATVNSQTTGLMDLEKSFSRSSRESQNLATSMYPRRSLYCSILLIM